MTSLRLFSFVRGMGDSVKDFHFYPMKGFHPNGGLFKTQDLSDEKKAKIDAMFTETLLTFKASPEFFDCFA